MKQYSVTWRIQCDSFAIFASLCLCWRILYQAPSAPGEIEKKTCLLTRKNNARLACNISAYARASKFETIRVDNLTGKVK
jgi:hypothetical protein